MNTYTVEVNTGENGSVTFPNGKSEITVNHGDNTELKMIPQCILKVIWEKALNIYLIIVIFNELILEDLKTLREQNL